MERTEAPGLPAPQREDERPVFASETQRRARVLRVLGWTLASATALWLVALVLGAFGLHPLPSLGLPDVPGGSGATAQTDRGAGDQAVRNVERAGADRDATRLAAARDEAARDDAAGSARGERSARRGSGDREAPATETGGDDSAPAGTGSGGSGTTTPTAPAAPPTTAPAAGGNSATAPGAVNRPDRTTDAPRGNSGSAPGATTSGERRGGPKADTTTP
ncbi:MAG TPA: hypothetical protein VF517_03580 [Thermoleophilaceae bacterium]